MNHESVIWIAEDDRSLRWVMEKALVKGDMHVKACLLYTSPSPRDRG